METKTIRFEKGEFYIDDQVFYTFCNIAHLFKKTKNRDIEHDTYYYYECLKSFTVQINIIEDENS